MRKGKNPEPDPDPGGPKTCGSGSGSGSGSPPLPGMKLTWRRGTRVAEEHAAAVRNIRRTSETALCTR
jgi:hypothetical protein